MLRSIFFVAVCALCYGTSYGVEFKDCGSKVGSFTRVGVTGCTESQSVCDLIRETNATIEIDFTSDKEATAVTAAVYGVIADIDMPFPLPNPNACTIPDSGITCPLPAGSHEYKATIYVDKMYPKVSVKVKWLLLDENKEPIVCVLIPAKIK